MPKKRWFGLGLLVIVGVIIAVTLLTTFALRVGLNQVPGLAPVLGLSGRVLGPVGAEQLVWSQDGLTVTIDGLALDHTPTSLLGGHVELTGISARRIQVELPPPADPPEPQTDGMPLKLDLPRIELPFDISSATVDITQVLVIDAQGEVLIDSNLLIQHLALINGVMEVSGLRLEEKTRGSLTLDAKLDSGKAWAGQMVLGADLLAPINSQFQLQSEGDLNRLQLRLDAQGEVQTELTAEFSELRTNPQWELQLSAGLGEQAALRKSLPPGPLTVELTGKGDFATAQLSGELQGAGYRMQVQPIAAGVVDGSVQLSTAQLSIAGPVSVEVDARGHWPLSAAAAAGELTLSWTELQVADAEPSLHSDSGELGLSGRQEAFQFVLDAALARGDLAGSIRGSGEGTAEKLSGLKLRLDSSAGQFNVTGDYQFQPLLANVHVDAVELRPELAVADWPGLVSLKAQLLVRETEQQIEMQADIEDLSGQLRGSELSGRGSVAWVSESWPTGELALGWGGNLINYQRQPNESGLLSVDARNLQLGAPQLDGRLELELQVPQRLDAWLELTGKADARDLKTPGLEVAHLRARRDGGSTTPIQITGSGLVAGQVVLDEFDLNLQPQTERNWTFALNALGPSLAVNLQARLAPVEQGWQGVVSALTLEQQPWPAVALTEPAQWSWLDGALTLQRSCLSVEEGLLCAQMETSAVIADEPADLNINLQLEQLSLAPLRHLSPDLNMRFVGALGGTAQATVMGQGGFRLTAELAAPDLSLSLPGIDGDRIERALSLAINARHSETGTQLVELKLGSAVGGELLLSAEGDSLTEQPQWALQLQSNALNLVLLDGVSPELIGPKGLLDGTLRGLLIDGQFSPEGQLQLTDVSAELPSAGTQLSALNLDIDASVPGRLGLRGSGKLGEGQFQIEGSLPLDAEGDANLSLKGEDLLIADLPIVRMTASPDLQIDRTKGKVTAKGSVTIPSAMIDLARFEPTVQASSDVVVVDDPVVDRGPPIDLYADIKVVVGDQVRLKGFGLDGRLKGSLSLRERPGKLATGRGELDVTGNYRAYGQDLDIQRGKLLFAGGPVANPGLDLLAVRELDRVKVGVRVRGPSDNPVLTLYSDPPLDQAEALSYLVLGKPLNSATGNDGDKLGAAAAALGSAAGGLLASKLGAGTGLEIGVESSSDLGGAALTVGRFLTPKLYFGVGQSLFESLSVAILRFRLSDSWELEGVSGREFKAGVNYKMER